MKINPNNLLRGVYSKNMAEVDKLLNKGEIKATVVESNMNNVKLVLENGRQLSVKSNIPLENFLGEKLIFKIVKSENEIVIRPQIQGTAQQREMNMKASKLLRSMNIQDTSQNREIAKEMMKSEVTVNKENFFNIKENINSFEKLKFVIQSNSMDLKGEIENIIQKDIKNVVREIVIGNKGDNVKELSNKTDISSIEKKDLIFLYKNGQAMNMANINALNSFLYNGENIFSVLDSLDNLFDKVFKMRVKDEGDGGRKDGYNGDGETDPALGAKENGSGGALQKEGLQNIIKNLTENTDGDGSKLAGKKEILKEAAEAIDRLLGGLEMDKDEAFEMETANNKLKFLYDISKTGAYVQIPINDGQSKRLVEMTENKKGKKSKKDHESYSVLFSLDTERFKKVSCRLEYSDIKGIEVIFGLEDEKAVKKFKSNSAMIYEMLQGLNFKNISVNFKKIEECDVVSVIGQDDQNFPNFDIWV
ncbi:hypothetical protein SAMN02745945_00849 [Peptoclostridium litorale DSM 5388]|uniref:Flagellar hook-length control protein-like C-terminal domain-containing protein n=1 Tax=Peptoclostridium litorale DSM 5388 TaxID=1121324 RepID=A0A069RD72_PEPLI|nr:hypothetical protein [Peptoclostridium litorale]KDR94165.1 hypothetical protein CLIT_23c04380 [Peptoclostridium litorale DSM 5388]SIN81701.1 hypothetical protein SAMN02745945_00849 [Peptoclostridium litorale DSM 5388]